MKALIIFGHPDTNIGFAVNMLEAVKNRLQERDCDFEVLDLYKMNYDPVLKSSELYTAGNREISSENLQIQQKIKEANGLIFIYPVWWGGMPAIMKGFMDRVFTPWFAFKYRKDKLMNFVPDKLLDDKKIAAFVSFGAPRFVYAMLLHPVKIINKFVIFGLFSKKSKTFCIYKANSATAKDRMAQIAKTARQGVDWLIG
jgi:NAD(P)H dehydrogenase (quinone)